MNDHIRAGMAEATRLTRAGRLAEATALIQRTLAGTPIVNGSVTKSDNADAPIDAEFRVVDDSPPLTKPSVGDMASWARGFTKSATAPGILSPDALRLPNNSFVGRVYPVTPEVVPSSSREGGKFVDGSYTNTTGTRAYKLYIPSAYTGQALPLVVMLHGCTQTPVDFATGTRMNMLAEEKTFLVAYPEQAISANGSKCWNWFQASNQSRDAGEPSLIAGITRQIMHAYHVDASRVYVAGMSAGGAMATIMAVTYPDLYAAVGVHSGLAYGAARDLPSALAAMKQGASQQGRQVAQEIPLIMFHGDRDTTVATVNADHILDQWLNDGPGTTRKSAQDVKVERGQVAGGHAYTRSIYRNASGRVTVEQWTIHKAGHAWSGGSPNGSYTDPKGPDASAEMVRFFNEHSRGR